MLISQACFLVDTTAQKARDDSGLFPPSQNLRSQQQAHQSTNGGQQALRRHRNKPSKRVTTNLLPPGRSCPVPNRWGNSSLNAFAHASNPFGMHWNPSFFPDAVQMLADSV